MLGGEPALPAHAHAAEAAQLGAGPLPMPPLPVVRAVWLGARSRCGLLLLGNTGPDAPAPEPLPHGGAVVAFARHHLLENGRVEKA
jgi:hypothetical protein